MTTHKIPPVLLILVLLTTSCLQAQPITIHPDAAAPLDQRWAWGMDQGTRQGGQSGYWIGYSIRRRMGEHETTGTWNSKWEDRTSLYELIYGTPPPYAQRRESAGVSEEEQVRQAARRALDAREHDKKDRRESSQKVWKDIAILFLFRQGSVEPEDVDLQTMSVYYDLRQRPLYWLGTASDAQSLDLLAREYEKVTTTRLKKDLIGAVGVHQSPDRVVPFLERVLTGREGDEVRKQAAFWLGQQDTPRALRILERAVREDRSVEVRKQAVFGISQLDLDEATDSLIDLARRADDREVQKQAIFWLAQRASTKAADTLRNIVYDKTDTEVKKQAVFALTQLPDHNGVPLLIEIARTHPNPDVRKQAIFWLGQSGDPRALNTLIDIVQDKRR
ncbi:MAG: HEAT repeat domain-containing protein [Candidatus Latescibacteria bacterium]|nr:HEAT repeat domain-containing protein [Candidatus Latescibacterota bacterium]